MTIHPPVVQRKVLAATAFSHTAEYDAPHFHVRVDNDVTLEDILRPAFWAHHAGKLRPFNVIDIVRENMSLDVQVRVTEIGVGFVAVRVLRAWEDESIAAARAATLAAAETIGADVELPAEYKITHSKGSFVLTYIPTDTRIGNGYKTRAGAVAAARDHAGKAGIEWPVVSTAPVSEEA